MTTKNNLLYIKAIHINLTHPPSEHTLCKSMNIQLFHQIQLSCFACPCDRCLIPHEGQNARKEQNRMKFHKRD